MRTVTGLMICLMMIALAGAGQAAPTTARAPLGAAGLAYPGAEVQGRLEIAGTVAVQLASGALEAWGAAARAQAQAAEQRGATGRELEQAKAKLALVAAAKETAKSLQGFTMLEMKTGAPVKAEALAAHYHGLLGARGWQPFGTVTAADATCVVAMLAPGAKGIFVVVGENSGNLTLGLVTTDSPVSDLMRALLQAAGGLFPVGAKTGPGGDAVAAPAAAAAPTGEAH